MFKLPFFIVLSASALALGGCADRIATIEPAANGESNETSAGGDGDPSSAGSTDTGNSGSDEGQSDGYPCDEDGARFCEVDAIYECQGGQWVYVENCAAPPLPAPRAGSAASLSSSSFVASTGLVLINIAFTSFGPR